MTIDVLYMASIIAIFQSFLMAAFFALNKKNSRINNLMLVSLLLVFAVKVTCTLLTSNRLFYATTAQQQRIIFVFG